MGAPRKPKAIKQAQGTYRKDRDTAPEIPQAANLKPPTHLTKEAKALYRAMAPLYASLGLLPETSVAVFADAMQARANYFEIDTIIRKEGLTSERTNKANETYKAAHPLLKRRKDWLNEFTNRMRHFGGTPADIGKLDIVKTEDAADALEKALNLKLTG